MSKRTVTIPLHEYEALKHRNDEASKDLKNRLDIMEQELSNVVTGAYASSAKWGRNKTIQQYVRSLEEDLSVYRERDYDATDVSYLIFLIKDLFNYPLIKVAAFFSPYLTRLIRRINLQIIPLNAPN